jgi:SIR2-like protein
MNTLVQHLKAKQVVVFAGAGISMGAPANLPSWFELTNLLMQLLWDRLQQVYPIRNVIRDDFMDRFKARRNANQFPPDYQAQIMEDQVGMDYFRSLSSIDTTTYNPTHHTIARLAKHGFLKGLITTNFDTMLGQAFFCQGVNYQAFYDNRGYAALAQQLQQGEPDAVPIIKIHGTATDPASMVDTLKQRLKGRSKVLNNVMRHFLEHYYFLYSGFSGADLHFDPEYMGISKAAPFSPGFTYAYRKGSKVRASIVRLRARYGDKATALEADAVELFETLTKELSLPDLAYDPPRETDHDAVKKKLMRWVDSIAPMKAVNMVNGPRRITRSRNRVTCAYG